jgi:DNA-binding NarL/FixJ family response regulator
MRERIRVFVVEDQPSTLAGLRSFLEQAGDLDWAGEARSGAAALEQIVAAHPDVVLLGCRLSDMPGEVVAREIGRFGLSTRLLVLSALDDPEQVLRMLQAGAWGYLLKSEPTNVILEAVRAVAQGQHRFSQDVLASVMDWKSGTRPVDLSGRERVVLQLIAQGLGNKEIAQRLGLNLRTVEFHLTNVYRKLGVQSRVEAILLAYKRGLIS